MKTDLSVEAVTVPFLTRGVHRERSSYAGYIGYKAITNAGVLVAHLVVMEALDKPDERHAALWQDIKEAEALETPPPDLRIIS